jgi:hypothetical protein
MSLAVLNSKLSAVCLLALLAVAQNRSASSLSTNNSHQNSPCSAPGYRQFDFWLGDWDTFDVGSTTPNAHVKVDRLLEGCVLREQYDGADGHKGQSLSIYDRSRKLWHQSWVTNRGELLVIEGKFQDDAMVLSGADRTPDGRERQVRGIWKPQDGGVRETAVTSIDGGKTWNPWFDLIFRSHR